MNLDTQDSEQASETPGAGEDETGRQLAEKNSGLNNGQHDKTGLSAQDSAAFDQIAAGVNDTKNVAPGAVGETKNTNPASEAEPSKFQTALNSAKSFSKNKKARAGAALAAAVLTTLISAIGLFSQKLHSMIANILNKRLARVEYSIQRRAGQEVVTKIVEKSTGVLANSSNPLAQSLFDKIPIDKIEAQLADKGYVITAEGTGPTGKVHLTTPDGQNLHLTAADFENYYNSAAGTVSRNAITDVTEAVTHDKEVYQRRILRLMLQNEFDVKTWHTFDGTEDTPKDPQAAEKLVAKSVTDAAVTPADDLLIADISCIGGSETDCPPNDETDRRLPDGNVPDHPTWESTLGKKDGLDTVDTSHVSCSDPATKAACEADVLAKGAGDVQTLQAGLEKDLLHGTASAASDQLVKDIVSQVTKGGTILGAVNLAASADKLIYGHNNEIGRIVEAAGNSEVIGEAVKIASMEAEIRGGKTANGRKVSGSEVNAVFKMLEAKKDKNGKVTEPGIEGSNAFSSLISNDPSKGEKIKDDKLPSKGNNAKRFGDFYTSSPFGALLHPVLQTYSNTVGAVFSWIGSFIGDILAKIPIVNGILEDFSSWVGKELAGFLAYMIGTVVDGTETGAALMNTVDEGWDLAGNRSLSALGAPNISAVAASQIDTKIALEDKQRRSSLPLNQRLFNSDDPSSMVSQIALRLPSSTGSAISQSGTALANIFTNPIRYIGNSLGRVFFISNVYAADPADPYGITQSGFSEGLLSSPTQLPTDTYGPVNSDGSVNKGPDGKLNSWDCPTVTSTSQANMCLIDVSALNDLTVTSTGADNGGLKN